MQKIAHIAGLGFASIFGFSFMFTKIAFSYVSPVGIIAYRFLIACVVIELLRLTKVITIRFRKLPIRLIMLVVCMQPILYFLLETYGVFRTSSSEAGMMIALIPIFVTIFGSILLREKPKRIQIVFILLSVSGVLFIQLSKTNQLEGELIGFILLLGAVIAAALFNIASRKASREVRAVELTYFMMLSGAIVFNAICIIELASSNELANYILVFEHRELWIPVIYLGVIASIGGFFLVNVALGVLEAHVSSIYANLSTIVAIVAGGLFLQEKLEYYHFIGAAMILIGVYGTVRFQHKKDQEVPLCR